MQLEAAKKCKQVFAIDISDEMLKYARNKAEVLHIKNIEFVNSGFLNFESDPSSIVIITTTFPFHHLPDYWKGIALKRMNQLLRPGGIQYKKDVIIEEKIIIMNIQKFKNKQIELVGDFLREDAVLHFKEEYSTYDWVMDGC